MAEIKIININDIEINDKIYTIFKGKEKNLISFKAWSFLYNILKKYNIDLLQENIIYNEYGKPFLESKKLYFNISHSKNLIAIIISDKDCAIDIQYVNETKNHDKNIHNILSESEIIEYKNSDNKNNYFYMLWTKKEAVLKYCGTGINLKQLKKINNYNNVKTKLIAQDREKYYISYI